MDFKSTFGYPYPHIVSGYDMGRLGVLNEKSYNLYFSFLVKIKWECFSLSLLTLYPQDTLLE